MSKMQIYAASPFFILMAIAWLYYFRKDIRRWREERGPRAQMAREAAAEREKELERLRDELASKYLPPEIAKRTGGSG